MHLYAAYIASGANPHIAAAAGNPLLPFSGRRQLPQIPVRQAPARAAVALEFEAQGVVDGEGEILFRAQIAFRGRDGGVAEQQLDLLEVPACLASQFRAGAAQVVRGELAERGHPGVLQDQLPDGLLVGDDLAGDAAALVDRPEDSSLCNSSGP
jgi:hypothetical protein